MVAPCLPSLSHLHQLLGGGARARVEAHAARDEVRHLLRALLGHPGHAHGAALGLLACRQRKGSGAVSTHSLTCRHACASQAVQQQRQHHTKADAGAHQSLFPTIRPRMRRCPRPWCLQRMGSQEQGCCWVRGEVVEHGAQARMPPSHTGWQPPLLAFSTEDDLGRHPAEGANTARQLGQVGALHQASKAHICQLGGPRARQQHLLRGGQRQGGQGDDQGTQPCWE